MTSNATMAEVYTRAHRTLRIGWTQKNMYEGSKVCLVGAVKVAGHSSQERHAVQLDLANTLLEESRYARFFAWRSHRDIPGWTGHLGGHPLSNDGGIAFVEQWNDRRFRRKQRVLKLLAERRDHYVALAKDDRIAELTLENERLRAQLQELTARIEQLEIEIEMHKVETGFWKGRALEKKREEFAELVASSGMIVEQQHAVTMELWDLRP